MEAQAASGESVLAFAETYGLTVERIYRWRRQLAEGSGPTSGGDGLEFTPVAVTASRGDALVTVRAGDIDIDIAEPTKVAAQWVADLVAELRRS